MTTLAEFMIIAGVDNRPPMLEKSLKKKYKELSFAEKLQANCDLKATNIVLQGLPSDVYAIVNHHKVAKEIRDRSTFQRWMMAIFHDMIEETMEVFMDDFLFFGDSFSSCLSHLDKILKRCEDTNLVLNWEKYHFMVKEGIVLGHKISKFGIEVYRAKVDAIAKLPHPTSVKGVRSFLETPKVLSLAWEKFFEIQHAFREKQHQPEDIQELLHKLLNDLQIIREELANYINSPSWNCPAFYDDDDEYTIQYKEYLENSSNAITPDLSTEEPDNSLNNSLLEFETFNDHTEETRSGSTTTHADNSLPEYDSFHFEIEPEQGELTSVVMEDILGEPRIHVPNVLPIHLTLMLDSDFIPFDDSLGSDLEVSFPSGTRNKIFDPGIFLEFQSKRFLSRDTFSISFIFNPLCPVIETLLPFSSENEDQVFNPGIAFF
ncbi:hypothetical protein Tco_1502550 [Tanacetum coccineum]